MQHFYIGSFYYLYMRHVLLAEQIINVHCIWTWTVYLIYLLTYQIFKSIRNQFESNELSYKLKVRVNQFNELPIRGRKHSLISFFLNIILLCYYNLNQSSQQSFYDLFVDLILKNILKHQNLAKPMLLFLLILCFLSKISINGSVAPTLTTSPTSNLFQIGSAVLSSADLLQFSAANSTDYIKYFNFGFANSFTAPSCGIGYKKLDWDYTSTYQGKMSIYLFCYPAYIQWLAHCSYGNTLIQLQVSLIGIDGSLSSDLKSVFMGLSLSGTTYATNQLVSISGSHSFGGVINQTKVYIYFTRIDLQSLSTKYVGMSPINVVSLTSSTLILHVTFTNSVIYAGSMQCFALFFNPFRILSNFINIQYHQLSTGNVTGPPFSYAMYSDSSVCSGYQDYYIGLAEFISYDGISYELFTNSIEVNLTINNFNTLTYLLFNSVKICSSIIQCTNSSFPFLYRPNQQCYDICPSGYYGNLTTSYCQLCDSNCSTCDFQATNCTQCVNGTLIFFNFTCLQSCPNQTIFDSSINQCIQCTSNCLDCQITSTNCTSCINGTFLFTFQCLFICSVGYYGNTSTGNCESCGSQCLNCTSLTQCFACGNGSFLYNFSCVLTCPNQTYGNTSVNQCLNCTGTCQNCNYQSINCTSCINNTFYLNFNCYYNCPNGYYANSSNGNCQFCLPNCQICTAINVCTSCTSNHFLYPNFDQCSNTCPPNYFPNFPISQCQQIVIPGCISALYKNGVIICLSCNFALNLKYDPNTRSCICKNGYKLINSQCEQYCGDGIVYNMSCDDGNNINGDGCSFACGIQNNFNCVSVPNGPNLKSQCTYLPDIGILIISQTKVENQNILKLILKIDPNPPFLSTDQIKKFLNIKIANQTIDMSRIIIEYKNGIAQIYVPYTSDIQDEQLNLWTKFDKNKFSSSNITFNSILKGDNVALLYSSNLTLYKVIGTFNFSMAIFLCIFALLSCYKHKMIGLELIMPIQVILYSQNFYNLKSLQTSLYSSFKPVSFSIFTPDQTESKNNAWYKMGMTGGFLENYNFLGLIFLISTALLIISIFMLQNGERNRFKHKKAMRDWLSFGQFKIIVRKYQTIVWKPYYVSFCLSTIPLLFSISAKAMTSMSISSTQTIFDIINNKLNYLFYVLFMGALFYTSVPRIFYNNKKNLLKRHIFKQEGEKFKYEAGYCMYFQLQYMVIGFIYATCSSTLPICYTLSAINGLFTIYLIFKRPYNSVIDNFGALLSNFIVFYYLSVNLYFKLIGDAFNVSFISKISGLLISFVLLIQCFVSIVRLYIFWINDKDQNLKGLSREKQIDKFQYRRDEAFNKFVKQKQEEQQFKFQISNMSGRRAQNQNEKRTTINQQLLLKASKRHLNQQNPISYNQKIDYNQQQDGSARTKAKKDVKNSLKNYLIEKKVQN